jgi:hypothetical protein
MLEAGSVDSRSPSMASSQPRSTQRHGAKVVRVLGVDDESPGS